MGNKRKGKPLGHALLALQELAGTMHVAHYQGGPVAIAVEGE